MLTVASAFEDTFEARADFPDNSVTDIYSEMNDAGPDSNHVANMSLNVSYRELLIVGLGT